MTGNEERCGPVCISLSDLSEGKGTRDRMESTAFGDSSVEMGQHLDGLCDPFATNL